MYPAAAGKRHCCVSQVQFRSHKTPSSILKGGGLMKGFLRLMGIAALVGFAVVVYRAIRQYREDSVFDLGTATATSGGFGGEKRGISPELLSILADPGDKDRKS